MPRRDSREAVLPDEFVEKIPSRVASCGFDVSSEEQHASGEESQSRTLRERCDERRILVGCNAAQAMIHVSDRDVVTKFSENDGQANRVGAPRYCC
jgi:hypothetical protein